MNLRTTTKVATENFKVHNIKDKTLELLGNDVLSESRGGPLYTFKDLFGFDSLFYYNAQQTCNRESQDGEYGVAYLKKYKRKTLLVRKKTFKLTYKGRPYDSQESHCNFPVVQPDDCLIVTSFIPKDVESLFPNKNSILCSSEEFAPSSFQLDNNSLLVCFDNQLQSMTFKEFARRLHEYS
jgi:hypothetical protein